MGDDRTKDMPPGHPTGVSYSAAEVVCPNGHRWIQHYTYERDVNYTSVGDDEECCPVCGEDPDPTQGRPFMWIPDDDPPNEVDFYDGE